MMTTNRTSAVLTVLVAQLFVIVGTVGCWTSMPPEEHQLSRVVGFIGDVQITKSEDLHFTIEGFPGVFVFVSWFPSSALVKDKITPGEEVEFVVERTKAKRAWIWGVRQGDVVLVSYRQTADAAHSNAVGAGLLSAFGIGASVYGVYEFLRAR